MSSKICRATISFLGVRVVELLMITVRCFARGVITISLHSEVTNRYER